MTIPANGAPATPAPSTPPDGAVLALADVTVRRGRTHLLAGLTLTVRAEERWVVLGPNGAGKTTLLDIAAARMHPTSGTVHILDERLGGVDVFELRPRIGFASTALAKRIPSQESALNTILTASYGVTGRWRESYDEFDESRARDLLAAFDIEHLAERSYGTLSDGERKRVLIARALMTDPELLLLDEPTAGLDLGGREDLLSALTEILGDPASPVVVMVTHHVEEIPRGITHALLLKDGAAVAAGPIAETLTADNLRATFGLDLVLTEADGRFAARAL